MNLTTQQKQAILQLADAVQNVLDVFTEAETQAEEVPQYDLNKITWSDETGPKGEYQKAIEQESQDFRALVNDLEIHDGKLQRNGFFLWKFNTIENTVGRKKAKQ
ncbi:MAG: hypothetical protein JW702_07990 [Clostridiales bacterium]|nr:hypothetical protein [Clostridiales bacterium]